MSIDVEALEQAKDARLQRFLARTIAFLEGTGLAWAAFGSCGGFARRGRVARLTRDLDIILPWPDFERLTDLARQQGLAAERERRHFVRLRDDIYQLHAIPETFLLFDYRDRRFLMSCETGVDWRRVETCRLRFASGGEALPLRVAPLASLVGLALQRPLNASSIDDLLGLITSAGFAPPDLARFAAHNPRVRSLLARQIERLLALGAGTELSTEVEQRLRQCHADLL